MRNSIRFKYGKAVFQLNGFIFEDYTATMETNKNYTLLLNKLERFIRKYYKNRLIQGAILSLSILLALYLTLSGAEYFGHFSKSIRAVLFFSGVSAAAWVLYHYIFLPLAGLYKIRKTISHEDAAAIIGTHFFEVKDALLNTLQLKAMESDETKTLIDASIAQRIENFRWVNFNVAINFNNNLKYLRWTIVPLLALVIILFTNSSILTEAPKRIIRYNTHFEKPAPFYFELLNEDLNTFQNQSFVVSVEIGGEVLPAEVFTEIKGNRFKMKTDGKGRFTHIVENLQNNTQFSFWADGIYSKAFEIRVLPKSVLKQFDLDLQYPAYTSRKPEKLSNTGDVIVPEGTNISWLFKTINTDSVSMNFDNRTVNLLESKNGFFKHKLRATTTSTYSISLKNKFSRFSDSTVYRIDVVTDKYPNISLTENADSQSVKVLYFTGEINDDYGFTGLNFYYRNTKKTEKFEKMPVSIQNNLLRQQYFLVWDLGETQLTPGDGFEYYFEVADNDGIRGAKKVKTPLKQYNIPTTEELNEESKQNMRALQNQLKDAMEKSKKLVQQLKDIERKLLDKKNMDWQEKKQLEELLKKQDNLKKQIEEIKKQIEQNNFKDKEFNLHNEQILQKQEQLQELFKDLFNDEMKQMMEELQKLMEQNNKEAIKEQLDKMQLNEKDLEKQLDRMIDMYKQLDFEKTLEKQLEKLDELIQEQKKLADETEKNQKPENELQKKQEELQKELDSISEAFKELEKLDEELEKENGFDNPEEELKEIGADMDAGKEQLEKKRKKDAAKKQKDAADKMQKLKEKIEQDKAKMEEEQQMEDYNALRQILENLIYLSKSQESLMREMESVNNYNPKYVELVQKQKDIGDDMKLVEDSLKALSKRVVMLSSYINTELGKINYNLNKSMSNFANREVRSGRGRQQYAMTSMNNLAVMLSEILKNMQDDMQQNGSGSAQCKNPKKGKSGKKKPNKGDPKKMQQMQKELGEQLKKMKGKMEQGQQPGSSEWAKTAAQQEAIRRMLEQMKQDAKQEGAGKEAGELKKTLEEMEKIEKDLVNKRLSLETLKRIQQIETRLLEHEKSLMEREQDPKRESNEGKPTERQLPPSLADYLKQKEKENEQLRSIPPDLKPYYREKTKEYLKRAN